MPIPAATFLVSTFQGYQEVALGIVRKEQGLNSESLDALIVAVGLRKALLTKILEGNITPEVKDVYYLWRKSLAR